MRSRTDVHSPTLEQAVVADFIAEGHFARHIRRMRALYAERQAALVECAARELGGLLDVRPADTGMQLAARLSAGADDEVASAQALAHGVFAPALSTFYMEPPGQPGLLLGYAGVTEREIRQEVRHLAVALRI
jgi:GntR family transcriptional regulator/MocR family aminotransferase